MSTDSLRLGEGCPFSKWQIRWTFLGSPINLLSKVAIPECDESHLGGERGNAQGGELSRELKPSRFCSVEVPIKITPFIIKVGIFRLARYEYSLVDRVLFGPENSDQTWGLRRHERDGPMTITSNS